jgi:hypothetical protein
MLQHTGLVAKIKAGELEAYGTLDKLVSCPARGADLSKIIS